MIITMKRWKILIKRTKVSLREEIRSLRNKKMRVVTTANPNVAALKKQGHLQLI